MVFWYVTYVMETIFKANFRFAMQAIFKFRRNWIIFKKKIAKQSLENGLLVCNLRNGNDF